MKPQLLRYFLPALLIITLLAGVLRFYQLDTNPPGLYIDEVSIGNNAYALLTTGKDEHGNSMPMWFKAFGEYKMPVYIYLTTMVMAVLGKSDFAVRLASALFGTATVFILAYLVREVIYKEKEGMTMSLPLLSSLLLAISPWHIHFSRGGFEATIGVFCYILGIFGFVRFLRTKKRSMLLLSLCMWVITLYTYNAFRIITPLTLLVALFISYRNAFSKKIMTFFIAIVFFLALPLILFSVSSDGNSRFSQTTFSEDYQANTLVEKSIVYPQAVLKNYLSYFSVDYLFNVGDQNGRHQVPGMGLFYKWQLPFLLVGIYALITRQHIILLSVIGLLLFLSPLPGALARPSPHSLRNLLSVVPLVILIGYGIWYLFHITKKSMIRNGLLVLLFFVSVFEGGYYLHYYYTHYPRVNLADWGGGYKSLSQKTVQYASSFDAIVVDRNLPDTRLYFSFYEPELVVIEYVGADWQKPESWKDKKILYIRPYYGKSDAHIIDTVYLPNLNNDVFAELWEL